MGLQGFLPMLHLRGVKSAYLQAPLALSPFDLAELQAAWRHAQKVDE
jgi:hypothetical protein